jgi:hypothetical protein
LSDTASIVAVPPNRDHWNLAFAVSSSGPGGTRRGYPGLRSALEGDASPVVGEASRFYVRKVG